MKKMSKIIKELLSYVTSYVAFTVTAKEYYLSYLPVSVFTVSQIHLYSQ